MKKHVAWLAMLAAAVLVLSSCSSSKKSASGSSTTPGSSGAGSSVPANTDPVTVFVFGQFQATTFAFPEIPAVLQAHVAAVNAAGGINGHQIKLTVCNDQGVQTGATSCARDATNSDAVGTVAPYTRYGDAVLPLLQQANLVMVGNTASTTQDFTNPFSFPGTAPQAYLGGVVQAELAKPGCNIFTFIHWDTPTSVFAKPLIQKIVEAAGKKFVDSNEGTGAADYGPVAASISAAGVTCGFTFLPGTDGIKWTIAQKQRDPNFIIGGTTGGYTLATLKTLGAAGDNLILGNGYPDVVVEASNPEIVEFKSDLSKAGLPDTSATPTAVQGWGALKLLLGAIAKVPGKVDKAGVVKAMNNITDPATKLFGPYDTTKPNSQAAFARLFCTTAYLYSTSNGALTSLGAPKDVKANFN